MPIQNRDSFSYFVWAFLFTKEESMDIANQYDENGKKTGLWIERNEDGQVLNSINYKAGKLNGKYTEFNPITGLITSSSEYREGLLHGTYKSYDDKGNLRKSIECELLTT